MDDDELINLTPAQQMDQPNLRAPQSSDSGGLDLQNVPMGQDQKARIQRQREQRHQHGGQGRARGQEQAQGQGQAAHERRSQVQYQLKQVIGKGSYGIVYKAVNKRTRQIVAIKEVNYDNDEELTDIMSEIDLLKNLNHINIVKYHGFIQKSHNLYIILEYCSHGSLKNLISRGNGLDEKRAKIYVRQTLNGLHYLHQQGVIHRDIKAANLLLDENNVVKLADFGVSTQVSTIMMAMTLAGSLNWMAPEIITNRGATTLSDIWSLGATVLELLTGNPPFHNLVDLNIYYAIENDSFIPPSFLSPLAQDLLLACFQKNMYKRPTAAQLLKHKWLSTNNDSDKLEQYKEVNNDFKWDQDFKEIDIITNRLDKLQHQNGVSKIETKVTPNSNLSVMDFAISNEDFFKNMTSGKAIDQARITVLFNNLSPQDLALKLVELSLEESVNSDLLLIALFEYDINFNNSEVKQYFIKLGGITTILSNSSIIELFFIKDSFENLIQAGIMLNCNFNKVNDSVKFELSLKYLEVSNSAQFWCKWCSKNLDISDLLKKNNVSNKFVQAIILKLSFFSEALSWFPQQFITNILKIKPVKENFDQQSLSVIFKVLSSILIQFHKTSPSSQIIPPSPASSLSLTTSNISPSSSPSPPSSLSSTAKDNLKNSSVVRDSPISSITLPTNFLPWFLSFLDDPLFYHMKNLHPWKYYVIVLYHAVHLNKILIKKLIYNEKFPQLILSILKNYLNGGYYHNEECLPSIIHQSLPIITEMSNEIKVYNPILLEISIQLISFSEVCITDALEVLFNCLQLSLHDHTRCFIRYSEDDIFICFNVNGSIISLPSDQLIGTFFQIQEDNVRFGNFITRFMKICSLTPLDFISQEIIRHSKFVERCITFFQLYRNSLLIQIDLLKLIKLIFIRSFEYLEQFDTDVRDEIEIIHSRLQEIINFLSKNWTKNETGQVGHDSILIHQLCNDIKALLSPGMAFSSRRTPTTTMLDLDKDGFVIPRLPPPSSSAF